MQPATLSRARSGGAFIPIAIREPANPERLLTTGQVANFTNMSVSWLNKGRIYGWGPKFICFGISGKGGAVRYRWSDILLYIEGRICDPEVRADV